MNFKEFKSLKEKFQKSSTENKIKLYVGNDDLSETQYKQLLKEFPLDKLDDLEKAIDETD